MSVHVERKHKGKYNPFPLMKQKRRVIFFDLYSNEPTKPKSTNSNLAPGFSNPVDILEKSLKFQSITQELKKMNKMDLQCVIMYITQLPNFTSYLG